MSGRPLGRHGGCRRQIADRGTQAIRTGIDGCPRQVRNAYGWPGIAVPEHQQLPDPLILHKRLGAFRLDQDIGSETPAIEIESGFVTDARDRRQTDHGDWSLVENPMLELHHLDGAPDELGELGLQLGAS